MATPPEGPGPPAHTERTPHPHAATVGHHPDGHSRPLAARNGRSPERSSTHPSTTVARHNPSSIR